MSAKHQKMIQILLNSLALYIQIPVDKRQLEMYSEDLEDLSYGEITRAIKIYRIQGVKTFGKFPLPSQLIELVRGTNEDNALAAVERIFKAVPKFGSYQSKEAEAFIGDVGWRTLASFGGWGEICINLNSNNEGMMRSQMAKIAQSVLRRKRSGLLDEKIMLPKIENKELKSLINKIGENNGQETQT